jgi:hypothetical protein
LLLVGLLLILFQTSPAAGACTPLKQMLAFLVKFVPEHDEK